MNSKRYRPFRDFDDFLRNWRSPLETGAFEGLRGARRPPSVDVEETGKEFVIRIEATGMQPEDLRMAMDHGVLRIHLRKSHGQPSPPGPRLRQPETVAG